MSSNLMLALLPAFILSPTFAISNNAHRTGCYVREPRAAEVLQRYFGESIERLSAGRPLDRSAIDIVWQVAQQWRLLFAVPIEGLVVHKSGFLMSAGDVPNLLPIACFQSNLTSPEDEKAYGNSEKLT